MPPALRIHPPTYEHLPVLKCIESYVDSQQCPSWMPVTTQPLWERQVIPLHPIRGNRVQCKGSPSYRDSLVELDINVKKKEWAFMLIVIIIDVQYGTYYRQILRRDSLL